MTTTTLRHRAARAATARPRRAERDELAAVRADFPLLDAHAARTGKPLVYLDSGATSQKPEVVLDAEQDFYAQRNAAVHRGAHQLAEEATEAFEHARASRSPSFVGADAGRDRLDAERDGRRSTSSPTRFATRPLGAAERPHGGSRSRPGDEIVVTEAEHHANLVPWQELARPHGRRPALDRRGRRRPARTDELDARRHRAHPGAGVHARVERHRGDHAASPPFVARGPRGRRPHGARRVPVRAAPAGGPARARRRLRGVLAGTRCSGPPASARCTGGASCSRPCRRSITGGSMVEVVTMESTTYAPPPQRFEAGTQMVAQAVGMGARRAVPRRARHGRASPRTRRELAARAARRGRVDVPGVRVDRPDATPRDRLADGLVRGRRRARARRRAGARRRRHRRPGGPPLRAAAAPPVRRRGHARARRRRSTRRRRGDRGLPGSTGGGPRVLRVGLRGGRMQRRSSMEQLYQQVILDHAQRPHGRGLVPRRRPGTCTGESHQVNPTCGDEVTLRVDARTAGRRAVVDA